MVALPKEVGIGLAKGDMLTLRSPSVYPPLEWLNALPLGFDILPFRSCHDDTKAQKSWGSCRDELVLNIVHVPFLEPHSLVVQNNNMIFMVKMAGLF